MPENFWRGELEKRANGLGRQTAGKGDDVQANGAEVRLRQASAVKCKLRQTAGKGDDVQANGAGSAVELWQTGGAP